MSQPRMRRFITWPTRAAVTPFMAVGVRSLTDALLSDALPRKKRMKKAILLSALTMVGCHHYPRKISYCTASATVECADVTGADRHAKLFKKPAPSAEEFAYGTSVGRAIWANLRDPQSYAGKACTMRLRISPTGLLLTAQTEGGDPAYCAALLAAASATKFPTPPAGATDANHAILPLDFTETAPRVTEINEDN